MENNGCLIQTKLITRLREEEGEKVNIYWGSIVFYQVFYTHNDI